MYRQNNVLTLRINDTYNKLTFRCTAKTNACLQMAPIAACLYAEQAGQRFLNDKVKEINPLYEIKLLSVKYNYVNKYMFQHVEVPECNATATFIIMHNGMYTGVTIAAGLIRKIIERNKSIAEFEFNYY